MATVVLYIKNLSFKFVNFLLGKTRIFVIIIGWYLVITGLLFLVNPEKARNKLAGTGFGVVKVNILLICFFLWSIVSKISQALPGSLQTGVFWGGSIGLIILYLSARAATKRKLTALAGRLPVRVLVWFAWGQVVVGGLMIYLQHRLW